MDLETSAYCSFKVGQIVWAKVIGYPWWPAKVSHPLSNLRSPTSKNKEINRSM